ncbi:MAG: peptidoglycan-binding protein [Thermoleophilia bacterium]
MDTTAPPTPGGLSANILGDGRIALAWAAVADAGSPFTYTVRAQDAAGNTSTLSPGAPLLSTSGLGVYRVTLDGSPLADTAATTYSISGLPAGSSHTITLQAVDAAGNVSAATAPITLQIPVTLASIPALRLTANHVYARPGDPVSFTALLGDPATSSGVHWTLAPGAHADGAQVDFTYASAGRRMVYATLTGADGATTVAVLEVTVDATAPELTVTQRGALLTVAATDAESGVQTLEWAPQGGAMRPVADGRIPLTEGANHITVRAVDRAGNARQLTRDVTLDMTAPALSVRVPRLALGTRATVAVTARDAGSGLATLTWDGRTFTAVPARLMVPAGRRVTLVLTDRAGNTSSASFTVPGASGVPKGVHVAWNAGVPRLTGDALRLLQTTQRELQVLRRLPARWAPADRYTAVLAHVIRMYQLHGHLKVTGNVDASTRAALARDVALRQVTVTGR